MKVVNVIYLPKQIWQPMNGVTFQAIVDSILIGPYHKVALSDERIKLSKSEHFPGLASNDPTHIDTAASHYNVQIGRLNE